MHRWKCCMIFSWHNSGSVGVDDGDDNDNSWGGDVGGDGGAGDGGVDWWW